MNNSPPEPPPEGLVNILLVDDSPRNLDVLESILQAPDYRLVRAVSGDEALLALMKDEFAAIVLDIQMPDINGLELAKLIKQRKRNQHIPILFLTAYFQEDKDILEGYGAGAVDYLTKPLNPLILKSKVGVFVELFRATRALARANRNLEIEIAQRIEAQAAVHKLNNELEERVHQRTQELIQANAALAKSEEQFRRAIEDAPIPVIMQAEDGEVLQISKTWAAMTGYSLKEVTTFDAWLTRAYGIGANDVRNSVRGLFERDRGMGEVEFEVITRAGQRRIWAFSASSPGVLHDGRRFVVGMAVDITERKASEALLRHSEERYRHLVHALPAAVYTCNIEGRILLYNQAAVDLWGRRPEIETERWCGSWRMRDIENVLIPPDESPMALAIRHGETINSREIVIERPDGSRASVMVYPHPTRDADGNITGAVNMLVDITARKRAEESLRESRNAERAHRQELEALMQAAPAAIWISRDPECRHITGNPASYRLVRSQPGQNVSASAPSTEPPLPFRIFQNGTEQRPEDLPMQKAAFLGRTVMGEELEFRFPDGTSTWAYGSATPLLDENGMVSGAVGTFVDITSLKETEAALREAKAETEAASKAKDDFLAALSHELRTPLTPAILLASEWERDIRLPTEARAAFATIHQDINLEARLIDDLLDLTRIAHGKMRLVPEPTEVHRLLRSTWDLIQSEAVEKQLRASFDLDVPPAWVHADPIRLQQVFWNLIRNSVKFSPPGGEIIIRTKLRPDNRLQVWIIDHGEGIDTHDLERIFLPFDQGNRGHRAGGLGLGLAISRRLIELHGGIINAASEGLGRGATFVLELPLTAPGQFPQSSPREPGEYPRGRKTDARRILLVEDHPPTRKALIRLLSNRGYEVMAAENIGQARQQAAASGFDVVLSDLSLPDGTGHELMIELRQLQPACLAIALSGYGMDSDIQHSLSSGFDLHLTKPVDVEALEEALRHAGERRSSHEGRPH
ncbi:MAG TPA: response regulator [Verrucomicrobiae bacterium]|nr:response regulator [Verrucomicrobiae bacterium]